jgi:hypothetical protein
MPGPLRPRLPGGAGPQSQRTGLASMTAARARPSPISGRRTKSGHAPGAGQVGSTYYNEVLSLLENSVGVHPR